jgi:hypothetical protein
MRPIVGISFGFAAALTALTFCWPRLVHSSRGLCGEVRSTAGRLLAGAQVSLLRADADGRAVTVARTWSDDSGSFEFDPAPATDAGLLQVEASAFDHVPVRGPMGSLVRRDALAIELPAMAAIDGQVVAAGGASVAGVRLIATDAADQKQCYEGLTRWDGTFRLRVPPDHAYVVSGTGPRGESVEVVRGVEAGALNCELRLK